MTPPLPCVPPGALERLSAADPILAGVIARVGPVNVAAARFETIFDALLRSIIYQQLHGKAAAAIHARVQALFAGGRVEPAALLALAPEALRTAGLSANKLAAVTDLAAKTVEGTVPALAAARGLSDEELIARLTSVRGVGPWTVHMLLIFDLGRPDVLPTGDFAICKAFSLLYRKGRAVKPAAIVRHARRWQPDRSVASWYLWRSLDAG